jgi:hypothetical protein
LKWLRAPTIFADLLDRYPEGLVSDANLRFDLINRGFSPAAGDSAVSVFRRSAEFAGYTPSSIGVRIDDLKESGDVYVVH